MARAPAKAASVATLERAALAYLGRYLGSTARLRRVLMKRVQRSVEEHGTDRAEGEAAIDLVIAKLARLGMLDDGRLAEARVRVLRARGKSATAIRAALRHQGIDAQHADAALEEGPDELLAARALVRRRKLGPHRAEADRAEHRARDLAKLGRAGFSYGVAMRALADEEPD